MNATFSILGLMSKTRTPKKQIGATELLVYAVGIALFLAGLSAFMSSTERNFARWDYPQELRLLLGVIEIAGGLLMITLPRHVFWIALGFVPILAGAIYTHLRFNEGFAATIPAAYLIGLSLVLWLKRP
jgi:hypothetical protein